MPKGSFRDLSSNKIYSSVSLKLDNYLYESTSVGQGCVVATGGGVAGGTVYESPNLITIVYFDFNQLLAAQIHILITETLKIISPAHMFELYRLCSERRVEMSIQLSSHWAVSRWHFAGLNKDSLETLKVAFE